MTEPEAERCIKERFRAATISTKSITLPNGHVQRPGLGTVGQRTKVLTNHFKVDAIAPGTMVWQYDVAIEKQYIPKPQEEGEEGGKKVRREFIERVAEG
jgi:hypothetical protein